MLELCSVSKRLGGFSMSNLDLLVPEGEYFVLLGPSGTGKTVLIETIAGLMSVDAGLISWQGRDITRVPSEKRRFAVVYQDYALFPHMTVERNVAYGCRSSRNGGDCWDKVRGLAETLGIADLLHRYPGTLSGGEQQRVALARALAADPELLLLDEPLSALDVTTRRQLRSELKRINTETGITCLHVTHDIEEAMSLGTRIGIMLDRRIRQTGTPDELFRKPSDPEVANFLGMRNVLPVDRTEGQMHFIRNTGIHGARVDCDARYVWIAPEDIVLSSEPFGSSARNQFRCEVLDWEHAGTLLLVHISNGDLTLSALVTYASFNELGIQPGVPLYATFKSSAVHAF